MNCQLDLSSCYGKLGTKSCLFDQYAGETRLRRIIEFSSLA